MAAILKFPLISMSRISADCTILSKNIGQAVGLALISQNLSKLQVTPMFFQFSSRNLRLLLILIIPLCSAFNPLMPKGGGASIPLPLCFFGRTFFAAE